MRSIYEERVNQPAALEVHREADRLVLAEFAPPGVVINDELAIVQFRGRTGPFLAPTPGVASFDLLHMVRQELRLALRQAIDDARAKQTAVRRTGLTIVSGPAPRSVEIEVIPFRVASTTQYHFVVLFRELSLTSASRAALPLSNSAPSRAEGQLAQELASTCDYLQSVIEKIETNNEELKAANAELFASNEELRSANEDLQMAKEELQTTNEELGAANYEMTLRNLEATRLTDDLITARERAEQALTKTETGFISDITRPCESEKKLRDYQDKLKEALSWLVDDLEKRYGLQIQLIDDELEKLLDDGAAALVFRAVRELLLNVFKHAKTLSASVSLRRIDDQLDIDVQDKGVGFDPSELNIRSTRGGFGLFSLREQIARLGGTMAVSSAPSQGARISMRVPLRIVQPLTTDASKETPLESCFSTITS